jgi:D-alanyl-D-alanine carboxypeptidase
MSGRRTRPAHRRRARMTTRGRRTLIALGIVAVALAGIAASGALWPRGAISIPGDPCASPPVLRTHGGVTLQPSALTAFREAERLAGSPIVVVQSYRSCAQQALACRNICGSADGCPGRCLPPGKSYHQLGAAVDITAAELRSSRIVRALEKAGWCQSVPDSDPGHFSFGGCH